MMIRGVLLPAVRATWKTKWSWLIALLTLTPLVIQNEWKMAVSFINAISRPREYFWIFSEFRASFFTASDLADTATTAPGSLIVIIISLILIIILTLFAAWVVVNAQGVLILIHGSRDSQKRTLTEALNRVGSLWLPLLELNVSMMVARLVGISLLLFMLPLLPVATFGVIWWGITIPLLAVLAMLSFTIRLSIFDVVLNKTDIRQALKDSFSLFKQNVVACFELSFILYAITLLIITGMLTLLFSVVSPVELGQSVLAVLFLQAGVVPLIVSGAMLIIVTLVIGWLSLFQYTAWLTWYSEVTQTNTSHSFLQGLYSFIRSYVK